MSDIIQVLTTTGEKADAEKIARALVEQRLAACVQISGPTASWYWWQGKLESAEEWLCTAKTRRDLFPQVQQAIAQIHPYNVPEILAVPVVAASQSYSDWLHRELQDGAADRGS